ncbi:Arc family DNA-binding protein, partial [Acinetobacter venetianus]
MARTVPQFNLRVPQELKQIVEDAAKKSGRSINAEAVFRLEQSFTQDKKLLEISSVMTKTMTNSLETIDTALSKIVHVYLKSGFVMYSASSFDAEGKIYFTNLISYIHKYSDQDMSEFLNSLKNNSHDEYIKSIKNEYQLYRVIDFKSLIIHEQTHFLDLTSSLWGLEFSIRKNNVFLTKNNVEEQKNALNVFSLNYSELLKMHRPLNKNDNLLFDYRKVINYKHFYYYDENVGVCLEIQLNYKNSS